MGMSDYIKDIRTEVGHRLLQMPSVTILSFDKNSGVLLVKNKDTNLWVAPGGAIEPFEIPSDAAFFPLSEIINMDTQPWIRVVISDVLKNRKHAYFKPPVWRANKNS